MSFRSDFGTTIIINDDDDEGQRSIFVGKISFSVTALCPRDYLNYTVEFISGAKTLVDQLNVNSC